MSTRTHAISLATAPSPLSATFDAARRLVAEHAIVLALLGAYLFLALGYAAPFPGRSILHLRLFDRVFFVMLEAYTVVFVVGFSLVEIRRTPPGTSGLAWIWRSLRVRYLNAERLPGFLLMFVFARVFTDTFVSLKAAIPLINPFSWDATLMRVDHAIHFGHHPWELLQHFATPAVTAVANVFYNLWIFVLFGVYIWQAWSGNRRLRERFFITFALAWMLIGTAAATSLSSAGPCYFGRVTGAAVDPYAPLMTYLREVDREHRVWALAVQEALWDAYVGQETETRMLTGTSGVGMPKSWTTVANAGEQPASGLTSGSLGAAGGDESVHEMLNGISAMPSMHVAMSVLFALLAWNVAPLLGVGFSVFAILIELGSVHLGWHYAVDGYTSAAAVTLLWLLAGKLVDWRATLATKTRNRS